MPNNIKKSIYMDSENENIKCRIDLHIECEEDVIE